MTELSTHARSLPQGREVIAVAQRLVRLPSENPPGDTRAVCDAVAEELASYGFEIELYEPVEGFTSLIAAYDFPEPGRTLVLNGHVDVVPVGSTAAEWTHDPFGGQVTEGRLYGRGSLDMKGPVAALVVAARSLVGARMPLRGRLVVTAVADEEQGGHRGTGALLDAGKVRGDAALIAEPSEAGVILAHRGMCFVQLTTRGRSAHASVPSNGINAVEAMVDVLTACRTLSLSHTPHPLLGSPSVAVGTTIRGGEKTNVIPDHCEATLDIRHVPGMTEDGVLADLDRHFRACGLEGHRFPGVEIVLWGGSGETPPDAEIIQLAAQAHEREFHVEAPLLGQLAATDGWWFSRASIPTVIGLGPGGVAGCHVIDEHVDVTELERYARVYADVIASFLGTER